jgi:hypothetical protein
MITSSFQNLFLFIHFGALFAQPLQTMKPHISWNPTVVRQAQAQTIFFFQFQPSVSFGIPHFCHGYQLAIIRVVAFFKVMDAELKPPHQKQPQSQPMCYNNLLNVPTDKTNL